MIYGKGVNDMHYGWAQENEWNKRVYRTWHNMIKRCYSEKYHKQGPTYKTCNVCNRWFKLSNFAEDLPKIDGYNEIKFLHGDICLDKDIKSNGKNKEYCLEQCMFVSKSENTRQSNKTMDYSFMQCENNPMYGKTGENHQRSIKICQYDKETYELIKIWNSAMDIQRELNINNGSIIKCCKWYACGEDLNEWHKTYKKYPQKSAGGYIWKYAKEEEN